MTRSLVHPITMPQCYRYRSVGSVVVARFVLLAHVLLCHRQHSSEKGRHENTDYAGEIVMYRGYKESRKEGKLC